MRLGSRLAVLLVSLLPFPVASQGTEQLYQKACDDGDLIACNLFGLMYETGQGVTRDPARAATLYQRACEGGELMGCTNLGLMYETGIGVAEDVAGAAGLFRVACEGGQSLGCDRLAEVGRRTEGEAIQRYTKSGRVGEKESRAVLSEAIVEVPTLGIRAISDASGRFELVGLPAGQHLVRATRVGYELLDGLLEVPGNPDFVVLLDQDDVGDRLAQGRIEGKVAGAGEQAVPDVDISVLSQPRGRTSSNQQGRFTLRDLKPGVTEIRFSRLGYAPRTATLIVQPGRTVELSVTMSTRPIELEAIQVTVRSSNLEQNGFFRRAREGAGTHFTPQEIESIDPTLVSDLFRRVPGMRLQYGLAGEARVVSRRSTSLTLGPCPVPVYLDGIRMVDWNLDRVTPQDVEAIEVYHHVATPIEYTSMFSTCGVVLIWTRR